jgi:zinc transport system permease protein
MTWVLLPVILVAFWLALPPALFAAETETRGTLVESIRSNELLLRTRASQELVFRLDRDTRYYRGASADRVTNETRLPAGARLIVRHEEDLARVVIEDYRWYEYLGLWIDEKLEDLMSWSRATHGEHALLSNKSQVLALVSVVFVGLICGLTSSLVITNRMAFFSDALAHCAFAGVALGWLLRFSGAATGDSGILATMIVFGILVGLAIAFVREKTALANDTVIGVFFAGSMGLGAVLLSGIRSTGSGFDPDNFVFGDPHGTLGQDIVHLLVLLLVLLGLFLWLYNSLVFASFNPSLARSRNFPVRFGNYLFIVVLGLIVNICVKTVGALLISALLVVPAASAANLTRNLRGFFWLTVLISTLGAVVGWTVCRHWEPVVGGNPISLGPSGMIVVVGVIIFFTSMMVSRWVRGDRSAARTSI